MLYSRTAGSGRQKNRLSYGLFALVFLLAPVFFLPKPAAGRETLLTGEKADKVLVLVMGGLSLAHWQATEAPNLRALTGQGAVGIMNVRSAGSFTPDNAYATFGAGERALGSPEAGHAFKTGDLYEGGRAEEVFARRTGRQPLPGAVLVMDYPRILKNNSRLDQVLGPGTLGATLEKAGKKTAVLGNADTRQGPGREAALAVMNREGLVFTGEVGTGLCRSNPSKPWGMETDYQRLLSAIERTMAEVDCVVVELGDTSRVEKYRDFLLPAQREEYRRRALTDADRFLGALLDKINLDRTLLLLVTPFPPHDAVEQGDTLTPVLAAGPGFNAGLLFSPGTRRPGIITCSDLQATIFNRLGIPKPPGLPGRSLTWTPEEAPLTALAKLNGRIVRVNNARGPVLKGFVLIQIILFIVILLVILRPPRRVWIYEGLQMMLAGIAAVPLALLVLPGFAVPGVEGVALYLVAAGLAAAWVSRRKGAGGPVFPALLALVTAFFLLVDILRHSPLMSESLLGFSPVGGARYYGIGNEYLGILLGGSVIGATYFLDRTGNRLWGKITVVLFFALCLLAAATPWLGANLGGALALSVAYLVTGLSLFAWRTPGKRFWPVLAGGIGVLALLGVVDFLRDPEAQSHVGQLVTMMRAEGVAAAVPIILRKIKMNLTLIEYTIWSRILVTFLIVLIVLSLHPGKKPGEISRSFPALVKGFRGALAGSVAALVFNDSGIVAAATSLLFPVVTLTMIFLASHRRAEPYDAMQQGN